MAVEKSEAVARAAAIFTELLETDHWFDSEWGTCSFCNQAKDFNDVSHGPNCTVTEIQQWMKDNGFPFPTYQRRTPWD